MNQTFSLNSLHHKTGAEYHHPPCPGLKLTLRKLKDSGVPSGFELKVCCCSAGHPRIHFFQRGIHSLPDEWLKPVDILFIFQLYYWAVEQRYDMAGMKTLYGQDI